MKKIRFNIMIILLVVSSYLYGMNQGTSPIETKQKEMKTTQGIWRYSVSGQGQQGVLFIHGANSSKSIWRNQNELTEEGYKHIFIDLLGYGESDKPESGYTLANWLQGINAILEKEQITQTIIVAHSNGVIFAKEYYRTYPDQVSHLILLDGMLKQMIQPPLLEWMKSTLDRSDYSDFMRANADRMPVVGLSEEDAEVLKNDALNTPRRIAQAEFALVSDNETWQPLSIRCPVTIVHANNPMWDEEYISWLSIIAPQHQLIEWNDSGHFIPMQYPSRLNQLITEVVAEDRD